MSESQRPGRRRKSAVFRPRFTLMIVYLAAFFVAYGLLFALPDLLQAAAELPPGPEELTPDELEQARGVAAQALSGGKIQLALMASVVTVGLAAWQQALPGLREPR